MMKKVIILLAILFAIPLMGQDKSTPLTTPTIAGVYGIDKEVETKVNSFFGEVMKGDVKNAYKILLFNSPIKADKEDKKQLIAETKRAYKYYGELSGIEFVSAEKVTDNYIRVRYLGLCENYPMRWIFTLYNSPTKGWIVTKVLFDDMTEYFFSD